MFCRYAIVSGWFDVIMEISICPHLCCVSGCRWSLCAGGFCPPWPSCWTGVATLAAAQQRRIATVVTAELNFFIAVLPRSHHGRLFGAARRSESARFQTLQCGEVDDLWGGELRVSKS